MRSQRVQPKNNRPELIIIIEDEDDVWSRGFEEKLIALCLDCSANLRIGEEVMLWFAFDGDKEGDYHSFTATEIREIFSATRSPLPL